LEAITKKIILKEEYMDLSQYAPSPNFWRATTIVIIVTVVVVPFLLPPPTTNGIFITYLWLTFELALVSGGCVGFLQAAMMPHLSFWDKARWVGITLGGTIIGWGIVFAFGNLLGKWFPNLPILSDQFVIAVFRGLLIGVSIGSIIGLVTGLIQAGVQRISAHQWIVGNVISWSIGVTVPIVVFWAILSTATLFF
jgi:hypothetical protein